MIALAGAESVIHVSTVLAKGTNVRAACLLESDATVVTWKDSIATAFK
jgi:hypothetical protein